ncbi:MAG: C39 family peptidase [Candidatus Komeilibacteria bacterium]|nr:C39 family peptidase [Candidatus Komeilibacteria bacterium]
MPKLKFIIFFLIALAVFTGTVLVYINDKQSPALNYNNQVNGSIPATKSGKVAAKPGTVPATTKEPGSLNLPIPFTAQAPTGNWDLLHNEACEEASAIMANAYLIGDKEEVIPAARVETEISGLTAWQDQNFGYHLDTTAQETAQMIMGFYGLKATAINGYAEQDIKDQINLHHVVILPVNGQVIGNPNYKQPGPIYHMLVIRGYTATGLITDDSGTKRGENYYYTFSTLHNAGADWDHTANTIDQSKKVMIVVSK